MCEPLWRAVRFGEGVTATVAFLICPCDTGAPADYMLAAAAAAAMPCYLAAEYLSRGMATVGDESAAIVAH